MSWGCELSVIGDVAVEVAGIADIYFEKNEEEIEYEPDDGNE